MVKVTLCCRTLKTRRQRRRERDAVCVESSEEWGGGIPLPIPIRLGSLGSVVSSPGGVRGGAPPENEFDALYLLERTLLVEKKSDAFIDKYSVRNEPTILRMLKSTNQALQANTKF